MELVDQAAQQHGAEDGGGVEEGDGDRGREVREAKRPRVRRKIEIRDEEAEALDDVTDFEDPEGGGAEEAEAEGTTLEAWAEGETRFHEEEEGAREDDQDDGPGAQHGCEAVFVEAPVHDEGDDDARHAGPGPHDAEGKAFAADEPFIEEEDGGRVEHGAADGVEDALADEEVCDGGGEGRSYQGDGEEG